MIPKIPRCYGNYGKPDLFVTMTCNPNWPEMQNALNPGETAAEQPDLCCHVFHQKYIQLLDDVTNKNVMGLILPIA